VDPVIPSANPVDPGQPAQIVVLEGDEERIIDRDVRGLGEEVKRLRGERRALNARATQTTAERDALAKENAALTQRIADAEALKADAEAWREHKRAENDKLKEANAAAIASLTPEQRAAFDGITDEPTIARMLTLVKAQAAAPTPAPATYPAGGAAPVSGGGAGADLTPAEEAWVRSERKDLAGLEVSTIKAMFKKFGPK
jgi:hypothetical protein